MIKAKTRGNIRKSVAAKIAELEGQISELERRLRAAKADQKNPLSQEFQSRIEGHDNLAATMMRELENAQSDLTILRQVAAGDIQLSREKFLRGQLPGMKRMRESAMNIVAGMEAELAAIERAKRLLR